MPMFRTKPERVQVELIERAMRKHDGGVVAWPGDFMVTQEDGAVRILKRGELVTEYEPAGKAGRELLGRCDAMTKDAHPPERP